MPNSGRDRVECTIVGPSGAQDPSPDSFSNQIIDVLKANNFSIPETEIYSGNIWEYYAIIIIIPVIKRLIHITFCYYVVVSIRVL